MNKIKLKTLELITFDKNNSEHLHFLKTLIKDESITERFQGIFSSLIHNNNNNLYDKGFFISNNQKLIGYIHIGNYNKDERSLYLRIAIASYKRGEGLGKRSLKEITDYIFENTKEVENLRLKIAKDNKASINTAQAAGYTWLIDEFYIKYNPYLEIEKNIRSKLN